MNQDLRNKEQRLPPTTESKKTDAVNYLKVVHRVGLLVNMPPDTVGLHFV